MQKQKDKFYDYSVLMSLSLSIYAILSIIEAWR